MHNRIKCAIKFTNYASNCVGAKKIGTKKYLNQK